jgi:hypothetical protein
MSPADKAAPDTPERPIVIQDSDYESPPPSSGGPSPNQPPSPAEQQEFEGSELHRELEEACAEAERESKSKTVIFDFGDSPRAVSPVK